MRTTLSIDSDVLDEVRRNAEAEGQTLGQSVSELLRRALIADTAPIEYPESFEPLPVRPSQPRVTMDLVNRLRDGLN